MAVFVYRALTEAGGKESGEVEAPDRKAAVQIIQSRGLIPIEAEPKAGSFFESNASASTTRTRSVSPALRLFTRELATLLRAGEPIERALALIAGETGDRGLSEALLRVLTAVRGGRSMAQAIDAEPAYFSRVYVGMVGAGEATGRLAQSLAEIADLSERQEEARKKFVRAMTYPAILCVVAIGAVTLMLGLVVPQFAPLLEGHESKLPQATNLVLAMSKAIENHGQTMGLAALVLVVTGYAASRLSATRQLMDRALLKSGFIGGWQKERITEQLARALGALLRGGLDLPSSLSMSAEMIDNSAAREAMGRVRTAVRQGQRLADALARENILSPIGRRLIRTGDESGKLNDLLPYLADQMERRIDNRTTSFLSILEPVLVVVLGIVVGGITVAILSAMISVNELAI